MRQSVPCAAVGSLVTVCYLGASWLLLGLRGRFRRVALDQAEAVLQLCDAELELFVVRPGNEAELLEEAVETRSGALREPDRLAAPAMDRLLDHLARLVAADAARPRELVRECIGALGRQRDRAHRREPRSLEGFQDEVAVIAGHAAWRDDADAAARVSTAPARARRSPRRPRASAPAPERPPAPARPQLPPRPARAPPASQRCRPPPEQAPSSRPTPARAP